MERTRTLLCPLNVEAWCFESSLSISDWAAWAQAVGSVAAIGAAIFVVWWQLRHQQLRDDRQEAQRMYMLWVLVYHARACLAYMQDSFKADPDNFHIMDDLKTNLTILGTIPLFDLPDDNAAVAVASAIGAFKIFTDALQEEPHAYGTMRLRESHMNALIANLEFSETLLRREVEKRGWTRKVLNKNYRMNDVAYPPLPAAA